MEHHNLFYEKPLNKILVSTYNAKCTNNFWNHFNTDEFILELKFKYKSARHALAPFANYMDLDNSMKNWLYTFFGQHKTVSLLSAPFFVVRKASHNHFF